jgi:hypothetical protein
LKIDKSLNPLLQRLDYLEADGPGDNNDGGGGGGSGSGNYDNSNFDEEGRDWNDPITFYHIFKKEYYFHHNWDEKRLADPNYRHCNGLTITERAEGKNNGCIPECEFYNPNPTVEEALAAIRAYYPNFPNDR